VTDTGLPEGVRRFITRHIDSVEQLETLLLLSRAPDAEWTAGAVAAALYTQPASAERRLASLHEHGLVARVAEARYRFAPADPRSVADVEDLAAAYKERRVAVITLIASRPMDNVRAFSDAFQLRKKDP
jgi:hypothetical protein